ncbi:RING finger protein 150 [Exaiptasia diaphana]|uniref:RING-type domain-containing protein n=1 Tax=Exaiptasia diaphana TaxID=2652724 RepID=A0A913Y5I5_EXADI|nr:RING finger protein 150 [Exaiptasia diaphana]KXJ22432.1 RING finger protein 150 [Exaiptasia diaphana]
MLSIKFLGELWTLLAIHVVFVTCFYEEKEQTKYTMAKLNITVLNEKGKRFIALSEDGNFGVHSPMDHTVGWLYKLSNSNKHGCNFFNIKVIKPWIALVRRGSCRFDDKIRNAEKHNASAIIIYDNEDSELPVMNNFDSRAIESVSIKKNLGESLVKMIENNKTIFVEISKGPYETKWQVNPTSVLFVSVSFIVLMVISLAWLVFYYVQRFRYVHARDKTEKRLTSAAKKAIAKLSTRTVSKKDEEEEMDGCPVCLDSYKGGDTIRILPCQHEFHKICIDPWLVEHRTCPMCKLNILRELEVPSPPNPRITVETEGTTTIEPEPEDHQNAADNPVVFIGDIEGTPLDIQQRRQSTDGESSGSADSAARILQVNADVNWERDERDNSTSNLIGSSVNT